MDKFTKYAFLVMVVIVVAMVISTYIGIFVVGGSMETTYISIMEEAAKELGLSYGHLIELDEVGEYIAFTIAGAVSGFVVGYLIPVVFEKPKPMKGEEND